MPRTIRWNKIKWGTLTLWLKKHRQAIKSRYGMDPFTKKGEINDRVLRKLYRDDEFLRKKAKSRWRTIKRKIHFKLYVLRGR